MAKLQCRIAPLAIHPRNAELIAEATTKSELSRLIAHSIRRARAVAGTDLRRVRPGNLTCSTATPSVSRQAVGQAAGAEQGLAMAVRWLAEVVTVILFEAGRQATRGAQYKIEP